MKTPLVYLCLPLVYHGVNNATCWFSMSCAACLPCLPFFPEKDIFTHSHADRGIPRAFMSGFLFQKTGKQR